MSADPSTMSASGEPAATTRLERIGYVVLAILLAVVLVRRVSAVDGFFLDEWLYVHGGEYIWGHFPGALVGTIPEWNRGTQRLYPTLIGVPWSVLSTSSAYTVGHLINVVALVSATVPAALVVRRVVDGAWLRLLGVALAVAIPWLTISLHLLTENLVFPLYLWVAWGAIRAAESPSARRWLLAVVLVGLLTLTRSSFAVCFAMLPAAAVAGEVLRRRADRDTPLRAFALGALRRNWLLVVACLLGVIVATRLVSGSDDSSFGVYGSLGLGDTLSRVFGDGARATRQTAATYLLSLVQGTFVFPFALGSAVALAGLFGRLGPRLVIPSVVALVGFLAVIVTTSAFTAGAGLEDRYVFQVYAPIGLLAPAALTAAARIRPWLVATGAATVWAFVIGTALPAANTSHFFAAPGGAFWTRVLGARLRSWEERFLGWTLLPPTGWLLVALALLVLVLVLRATAARPAVRNAVLGGGLALCALAQVASLNYVMGQELDGTSDAPGGVALSANRGEDRQDWVDPAIPAGAHAALIPGPAGQVSVLGGAEILQFWNRDIDQTVGLQWNGTAALTPPGSALLSAQPGQDGVATLQGAPDPYVVASAGDPRVQFPGTEVARSPNLRYAAYRLRGRRAAWTATDVDGDGAVLQDRAGRLTLDRRSAPRVRRVRVQIAPAAGATAPTRWSVRRSGRRVAGGRLAPGDGPRVAELGVPRCRATCPPVQWRLSTSNPAPAPLPFPAFGAPGPGRPVDLLLTQVRLDPAP